jgi:hypothetical protein
VGLRAFGCGNMTSLNCRSTEAAKKRRAFRDAAGFTCFASEGWWVMQESNLRPAD